MLVSIPGHQTNPRANDFILETPGCPLCSSASTLSLPCGGTTTRPPQIKHPASTESSILLYQYGFNTSSGWSGHPCSTYWRTLAISVSRLVQAAICVEVIGASWSCSIISTNSAGTGEWPGASGRGRRLMASALACWNVFLHVMVYS